MAKKYGDDYVDRQEGRFKRIVIQDRNIDWQGRIDRYKRKLEKAMREHGFKKYSELLQTGR